MPSKPSPATLAAQEQPRAQEGQSAPNSEQTRNQESFCDRLEQTALAESHCGDQSEIQLDLIKNRAASRTNLAQAAPDTSCSPNLAQLKVHPIQTSACAKVADATLFKGEVTGSKSGVFSNGTIRGEATADVAANQRDEIEPADLGS